MFGHALNAGERTYLHDHVSELQIEEWADRGHLVHLAEPDRFAARLRCFVDHHDGAGTILPVASDATSDYVSTKPGEDQTK